jgi:hypothetical protein
MLISTIVKSIFHQEMMSQFHQNQILFELGHNGVLAPLSTIFQLYHGVKLAEMLFG